MHCADVFSVIVSDACVYSAHAQIGVREVIQGWDLGILGTPDGSIPPMKEGGKRRLVIPSGNDALALL